MTVSFLTMMSERIVPFCTTAQLIEEIENDYNISTEAQALCDTYYLLHWSGSKFLHRLGPGANTLLCRDVLYNIQWHGEQNKIRCLNAERVAISFRRIAGNNSGIAIPKIIHGMSAP
jgi:hypothetical protein